jgi:hypothetical protein
MSRSHPLRVVDYLQHILEAISHVQDYTAGMQIDGFMADRKTSGAVIRNLEIIGEACNNIPKITQSSPPCTPASHGGLPMKCAMPWRTAISLSTLVSCGKPFRTICPYFKP